MNKTEFVSSVAEDSGLSKVDSAKAIDAFFKTISSSLKDGNDVRLTGFGTFKTTKTAARDGKNPRTGEKIRIQASNTVRFKPGKSLKDTVNK